MTYHRVRTYETGAPAVMRYETVLGDIGAPGPGQVRLRQEAAGVNFIDTAFRSGAYQAPLPIEMGIEGSGVVEAVGPGVERVRPGDRVGYFFAFGAYSDVRLIDAELLVKLPDDISTYLAAALITKGLTAWMLLKRAHVVRPGEIVLVHGAAGGVGSLVSRWAKALGATVIATVGTPSKLAGVRSEGIEHVLDSSDPELAEKVRAIAGGRGVDVVYEFVGKATFRQSTLALRDGGVMVHVGNASGAPAQEEITSLGARSIHYVQPRTAQYVDGPAALDEAGQDMFDAYRAGFLGKVEATRYALADAAQAHADLAARKITGSAILIP